MLSRQQALPNGGRFNRPYLQDQEAKQQDAIRFYQNEIDHGSDRDLKAYAQQRQAILQSQVEEIQRLRARYRSAAQ